MTLVSPYNILILGWMFLAPAGTFRLQRLPRKRRVGALDTELGKVNRMLLRRMQTRCGGGMQHGRSDVYGRGKFTKPWSSYDIGGCITLTNRGGMTKSQANFTHSETSLGDGGKFNQTTLHRLLPLIYNRTH